MIPSDLFDDYTDERFADELAIFDDWLIGECLARGIVWVGHSRTS